MKRKRRLKKRINSLEKQREIHLRKRKLAEELGQEELLRNYDKEIEKFEREKAKKNEKIK